METVLDLRFVSPISSLTSFGEVKKHLSLYEFWLYSLKVSTSVKDSFLSFY
jgi:hypothetical protein